MLARLLTRHGNRVGALLYGDKVDAVLPARGGRQQVLQLLQLIDKRRRAAGRGAQQATQLAQLLQAAQQIIKRRSSLFVVSDFISAPGWHELLGRLALRHEVTAVRLFDPLEMELPDIGLLTMRDAETGEELVVDTSDRGFRSRYAAAAATPRRASCARRSAAPASIRWSSRPTTTCSTPSCALPTCASSAAGSRPAAARRRICSRWRPRGAAATAASRRPRTAAAPPQRADQPAQRARCHARHPARRYP